MKMTCWRPEEDKGERNGGRSDKGEILFENPNTGTDNALTLSSVDFSRNGWIDSFFMPSTPKAKRIFTDIDVKVSFLNGIIDDIDSGFNSSDFLPRGKSLNAAHPLWCLLSALIRTRRYILLVNASKTSSLHSPLLHSLSRPWTFLLSLSD